MINSDVFIEYMTNHGKSGVTVRDVQEHFKISAKSAKEMLSQFGKQHVYKGSGMSYTLDKGKIPKLAKEDAEKKLAKDLETTRKYILEWLEEGNVDIEAWACDPQKRPPQHFIRD